MRCWVCGQGDGDQASDVVTTVQCPQCQEAWLCPTHEKSHSLAGQCAPFKVEENEKSGRYLVATRLIGKGELILSDSASLIGPMYTKAKLCCLNCLKTTNLQHCSSCNWPVCGKDCETGRWHSMECAALAAVKHKLNLSLDQESFHLFPCITPLRLLFLRNSDPDSWSVLKTFEDHCDERVVKDGQAWQIYDLLVINFVQKYLELQFSEAAIRCVIGIIRTNSVKMEQRHNLGEAVAVYPTYSFANHSCLSNTFTKKHKDGKLDLIALSDISIGEQIWTRYTTPQIGSYQRIMDIQKTWHFVCSCKRCVDPTELGSMMSALRCSSCSYGYLLPIHPTVLGSPWCCQDCQKKVGAKMIEARISSLVQSIKERREGDNDSLLCLSKSLEKDNLHANHYLIIGIKEIIIQRLVSSIRDHKSGKISLKEYELSKAYKLRSQLFEEVAHVLVLVDSEGTDWIKKLETIQNEAKNIQNV